MSESPIYMSKIDIYFQDIFKCLRVMRRIYFDTNENESTGTDKDSKKYKSLRPNVNIGFKL